MSGCKLSDTALAFVQQSQVVAGSWAPFGRPEFDLVEATVSLISCFKAAPVCKTQVDRSGMCSAIQQLARHVRPQLPTVVPARTDTKHMSCHSRVAVALEALGALRNAPVTNLRLIAELVGVTDCHLSRAIHRETALTFAVLLHGLRMIDVITMLSTSAQYVEEVADAAGYRRTSAMDRVFKEWFHITPSEFRTVSYSVPDLIANSLQP